MKTLFTPTVAGILLLTFLAACQDSEIKKDPPLSSLNSFKMNLDAQNWEPSVINPCEQTYWAAMSLINDEHKFYEIKAYRDPAFVADLTSENYFQIKVMNADTTGTYPLDGIFKDFSNMARLTVNDETGKRIYQNEEGGSSFSITITRFIPIPGSSVTGMEGFFGGTLYNIDDPEDSITIENGEFSFSKMNHYNFNQCEG